MKNLLHVVLKFERGNGDFRTWLDFFCEKFEIIGDSSNKPSVYQFQYVFDKDPYRTDKDYRPISEVMKTDNNKDLFDYYQDSDEDKVNNWFAQIESNYVTTLKIEPHFCTSNVCGGE